MKKLLFFAVILFSLSFVGTSCNSGSKVQNSKSDTIAVDTDSIIPDSVLSDSIDSVK